jgi:hypothetical protein
MQTANNSSESMAQRIVILALLGVLAVAAAYVWGTRLSAGTDLSLSQAPQYASLRGVAAARAVDAAALRVAAPAESQYASLRGVAAARAADAASTAAAPSAGFRGVAAVRAVDAGWTR